jgi:hypothetical protein
MTVQEAIEMYSDRFGGFPYFLFMGAPDEKIIEEVSLALETGKEISAGADEADY